VLTLPADRQLFDTCRLFDLAAMKPFGTFTTSRGADLDSCEAHAVASPADILVVANPLDSGGDVLSGVHHKIGALSVIQGTVEKEPGGNESCHSATVLPDTGQVRIRAVPYKVNEKVSVDLCRLAGATADAAAQRILRSGVPVSGAAARDYRLASRDACALVDQPTLSSLPGLPTTNTSSEYANWGCWWSAGDGKANLLVRFKVDDVWNLRADTTALTVAGKNAYQKPGNGDHNKESCTLDVEINRAKPDSSKAEAVRIYVDMPEPAAQQCAYAARVAADVVKYTG
jgi:serine/threonine-protein kinase